MWTKKELMIIFILKNPVSGDTFNTESTSQGGKNGCFFRKRGKKVNPEMVGFSLKIHH